MKYSTDPLIDWTPKVIIVWSNKVEVWDTNDGYADAIADVILTDLGPPNDKTKRPTKASQ